MEGTACAGTPRSDRRPAALPPVDSDEDLDPARERLGETRTNCLRQRLSHHRRHDDADVERSLDIGRHRPNISHRNTFPAGRSLTVGRATHYNRGLFARRLPG